MNRMKLDAKTIRSIPLQGSCLRLYLHDIPRKNIFKIIQGMSWDSATHGMTFGKISIKFQFQMIVDFLFALAGHLVPVMPGDFPPMIAESPYFSLISSLSRGPSELLRTNMPRTGLELVWIAISFHQAASIVSHQIP